MAYQWDKRTFREWANDGRGEEGAKLHGEPFLRIGQPEEVHYKAELQDGTVFGQSAGVSAELPREWAEIALSKKLPHAQATFMAQGIALTGGYIGNEGGDEVIDVWWLLPRWISDDTRINRSLGAPFAATQRQVTIGLPLERIKAAYDIRNVDYPDRSLCFRGAITDSC